jgi:hypothetical protein
VRRNAGAVRTRRGGIDNLDYADKDERKRKGDKRDRQDVEPFLRSRVLRVTSCLAGNDHQFPKSRLSVLDVRHERAEIFPRGINWIFTIFPISFRDREQPRIITPDHTIGIDDDGNVATDDRDVTTQSEESVPKLDYQRVRCRAETQPTPKSGHE